MCSQFDWKFYIFINPNLINLGINTEGKCLAYWYNIQNCESVSYHIDKKIFNWEKYLEANPDLSKLGINNEQDSLIHWYNIGKYENRSIKPNYNLIINNNRKDMLELKNLNTNNLINNFKTSSLDNEIRLSKECQKNIEINLTIIDSINCGLKEERNNINYKLNNRIIDTEKNDNLEKINYNLKDDNINNSNYNYSSLTIPPNNILNKNEKKIFEVKNSDYINNKFNFLNLNDLTNNLKYDNSKILINILTRTSQRKNYFSECRKSVLEQTYGNIRHIVSVDDIETYNYVKLNGCEESNIIRHTRQIRKSEDHMPYNLYMNSLLDKVNLGWIMFLDDDDILINKFSIQTIINNLPDTPSILIFKTEYSDSTKPDKFFKKNIVKGDITSNCFIFHSSLKKNAYWNDKKGSDYFFLNKLSQKSEIFWLNQVLTKVNNQYIMGRGNRIDKNISDNKIDILSFKNLFLSSKNIYFQKKFTKTCYLNKYFDHIYILNLDRRIDKFVKTVNRLTNYNITYFERFIGIDGNLPHNKKIFEEYLISGNDNFGINKKTIPSSGSYFILESMKLLLKDAIKNKYSRILIFQDDIIIHKDFNYLIQKYDQLLTSDWGLIYFGASQHNWKKVVFSNNYYIPNNTEGAFAFGLDHRLFNKLIELTSKSNAPFDSGPLSAIQNYYPQKCYVIYPNLIISDVTESDCRLPRNQIQISEKFRWKINHYDCDFYLKIDLIKLKLNNNMFTPQNFNNQITDIVSVIISAYNCQDIIETSIKSICNQTYKNLEILIIDDNSNDNTYNILKQLSSMDNRIKFYKNKRRLGEFVNRNFAIKNCQGKFITFQDPRHYSFVKRIEYQVTFLKNNLQFEGCTISTNSVSNCKLKCLKSSLFIRNSVINKIGYFDSVYFGGTKEYLERILISNLRIYCIDKYLYTKINRFNNTLEDNLKINDHLILDKKNIKFLKKIYQFSYQIYFERLRKKKHILASDVFVNYPNQNRLFQIIYTNSNQKNLLEVF